MSNNMPAAWTGRAMGSRSTAVPAGLVSGLKVVKEQPWLKFRGTGGHSASVVPPGLDCLGGTTP